LHDQVYVVHYKEKKKPGEMQTEET